MGGRDGEGRHDRHLRRRPLLLWRAGHDDARVAMNAAASRVSPGPMHFQPRVLPLLSAAYGLRDL